LFHLQKRSRTSFRRDSRGYALFFVIGAIGPAYEFAIGHYGDDEIQIQAQTEANTKRYKLAISFIRIPQLPLSAQRAEVRRFGGHFLFEFKRMVSHPKFSSV
jgi:hypothetical protein